MQGSELQNLGKEKFSNLELFCLTDLPQIQLKILDEKGSYATGENLEFDYLIPIGDYCLIGEISSRSDPKEEKKKYLRYLNHFNMVSRLKIDEGFWIKMGVNSSDLKRFRSVKELRGFTISTHLQKFDVDLPSVPNVINFYQSDWKLLVDYADVIGIYAKNHFLFKFGIQEKASMHQLAIKKDYHGLLCEVKRNIATGSGLASLYTFQINPYDILPLAQVFRRDNIPSLRTVMDYQRPLIKEKLREIRELLLSEPNFIFPGNILVVLSKACKYDSSCTTLTIPSDFGVLQVIDGQHRLFSYADKAVEEKTHTDAKVMVTAIAFDTADEGEVNRFSARTFIEINSNQTPVEKSHIDAIAYSILGMTNNRALAAETILRANSTKGKLLYGIFKSGQTGIGVIQPATVLVELKSITDLKKIQTLTDKSRSRKKQGYENLLDSKILELAESEKLLNKSSQCIIRFFGELAKVFPNDWPQRGGENKSSLALAKMFSAYIRLLRTFIEQGKDWKDVEKNLLILKKNLLRLREMPPKFTGIILDSLDPKIPGAEPSVKDDFDFLVANLSKPTSIEKILSKKRIRR